MANPEHLEILRQGVSAWNAWRKDKPEEIPCLSEADLSGVNAFQGDFRGADLTGVKFKNANISEADFTGAQLVGADFNHTRFSETIFDKANLENSDFSYSYSQAAKFRHANLKKVRFGVAHLLSPRFSGANMSEASLMEAVFYEADFSGVNLARADLMLTVFMNSNFGHVDCRERADMTGVTIGYTVFSNIDLNEVKGLETVRHIRPSTIGIDTVYRSAGFIPDAFLRDAGVPEESIDIARSIRNGPPIQWNSCFISYSTKDEEFARRLHARMRAANMRVWFAPEDLKGGKILHEQLFEAIQIYDRLLIVLSEHSIQSEWVMTEIRKAREVEKKEKRRKLFPIRLTDFETLRDWTCFDADTGKDLAVEVREYFIPDFSSWKDHDAFESAFARLKKDLEAENSKKG